MSASPGIAEPWAQVTREALRLKTTIARLKLKGLDGSLHKQWSMAFNSTLRAEPYQFLHFHRKRSREP